MDKERIKQRMCQRIDQDDIYAADVQQALDTEDDAWLMALIAMIGIIIEIGSAIWNWIKSGFR